jgi:hypothetical protein
MLLEMAPRRHFETYCLAIGISSGLPWLLVWSVTRLGIRWPFGSSIQIASVCLLWGIFAFIGGAFVGWVLELKFAEMWKAVVPVTVMLVCNTANFQAADAAPFFWLISGIIEIPAAFAGGVLAAFERQRRHEDGTFASFLRGRPTEVDG